MAIDAHVDELNGCRVCGRSGLKSFMTLPDTPVTGAFLDKADAPEFLYPLKLYLCEDCNLVQSQHDISFQSYYEDYAYTINTSTFAKNFAESLAECMVNKWDLKPGSRVLEIGSGDGTQLACFKALGMRVQGFEPSSVLTDVAIKDGIPTVNDLFMQSTSKKVENPEEPFQLVLLTHVLDHLPGQKDFLDTIMPMLDPENGMLLIETHNFDTTFHHQEYCLIQHEHTIYPTAAALQTVFARAGLDLIDVGILPQAIKRAHSLMVLATPSGSRYAKDKLDKIPAGPMADFEELQQFGEEVKKAIDRVGAHIRKARANGQRVAAFGAGGRGIMSLAAAAKVGEVEYICDSSPAHHGKFTPVARVPIVDPSEVAKNPVDDIIVFSYGYMDEIKEQLKDYTAKGGKLTSLLEILDGH